MCKDTRLFFAVISAGIARTLFMEQRERFAASIDLQSSGPLPSAAALATVLETPGGFGVAFRGGRSYDLQISQGSACRPRVQGPVRSALVTGGSKVSTRLALQGHRKQSISRLLDSSPFPSLPAGPWPGVLPRPRAPRLPPAGHCVSLRVPHHRHSVRICPGRLHGGCSEGRFQQCKGSC